MVTPASQKADVRPISFLLDGSLIDPSRRLFFPLSIRPEDLTRAEPSRLSTTQTLGGAWADNFGPGLKTINISGHTGWRGSTALDGQALFINLHTTVFQGWHAWRDEALGRGMDPNGVKLIFIDRLDGIVSVVAPMSFTLRRSKSRPLLMQYQIAMNVLEDGVGDQYPADDFTKSSGKDTYGLGIDSLIDAVDKIEKRAKELESLIGSTFGEPMRRFADVTAVVLNQVTRIERAVDGVASAAVRVALDLTRAGSNLFRAVSGTLNLPNRARARIMEIAGAFTNAFCVIKKIFNISAMLPNYSDVYGASNCSSTAGGSPLSPLRATNPFYGVTNSPAASAGVSSPAMASITSLTNIDTVLAPVSIDVLAGHASIVADGVYPNLSGASYA